MEISEKKAVKLLRKYAPDEKTFRIVLAHSKKGQEIALKIAKNIPEADNEFIKIAMLLHDIGRFKYPPRTKDSIRHGIEGAKILRKENFFKYARVAERHLGVGITKEDIKKQNNASSLLEAPDKKEVFRAEGEFLWENNRVWVGIKKLK